MAATFAELELAYRRVTEGAQRVADQRRRSRPSRRCCTRRPCSTASY
jgi:hypothetical protein